MLMKGREGFQLPIAGEVLTPDIAAALKETRWVPAGALRISANNDGAGGLESEERAYRDQRQP